MAESMEKDLCDYLQLRHVNVKQDPLESGPPPKMYKVSSVQLIKKFVVALADAANYS